MHVHIQRTRQAGPLQDFVHAGHAHPALSRPAFRDFVERTAHGLEKLEKNTYWKRVYEMLLHLDASCRAAHVGSTQCLREAHCIIHIFRTHSHSPPSALPPLPSSGSGSGSGGPMAPVLPSCYYICVPMLVIDIIKCTLWARAPMLRSASHLKLLSSMIVQAPCTGVTKPPAA